MSDIINIVIDRLKESELSHYQIAKETGITSQTISNYRRGVTSPKGSNLWILAKYFGIKNDCNTAVITEPIEQYPCPDCAEKNKKIKDLQSEIKMLREANESLKNEVRIQDKYIKLMEKHGLGNDHT